MNSYKIVGNQYYLFMQFKLIHTIEYQDYQGGISKFTSVGLMFIFSLNCCPVVFFLYFNKPKINLDNFYLYHFKLKFSKLQFPGGTLLWGADSCSAPRTMDLCISTGLSLVSYKSRQCINLTDYAAGWKVCTKNWCKNVIEFLCLFHVLVTSFSAPLSLGLHLQEPLFLPFSLYPYWVTPRLLRKCLYIPPVLPVSASISLPPFPIWAQPGVPSSSTPAFCHVCLTFCLLGGLCGLKQLSLRSFSPGLLILIPHASVVMAIPHHWFSCVR